MKYPSGLSTGGKASSMSNATRVWQESFLTTKEYFHHGLRKYQTLVVCRCDGLNSIKFFSSTFSAWKILTRNGSWIIKILLCYFYFCGIFDGVFISDYIAPRFFHNFPGLSVEYKWMKKMLAILLSFYGPYAGNYPTNKLLLTVGVLGREPH